MEQFCIQAKNLTKIADKTLVENINFAAYSGEIHAIIGNNGEGKTVFANLLSGVRKKTSGSILLNGTEIPVNDIHSAQKHGIYMLQQEQVLFPDLTIRDNIISGNEQHFSNSRIWSPSRKKMDSVCREYLEIFGLHLNLDASISTLDTMEKLIVQMCRILVCHPRVLILDEPSTSLTSTQWATLFNFLSEFKKQAVIIVITHNYSLLLRYCDRVSIIDDGTIIGSFEREEFTKPAFRKHVEEMKMNFTHPSLHLEPGAELMRVEHLHVNTLHDMHFSLHQGEIIGVAGLTASERASLIRTIRGEAKPASGTITFPYKDKSPAINLISSQDADQSLFMSQSIPFNITASNFKKTVRFGFSSAKEMRIYAAHYLQNLRIEGVTPESKPRHLSTGSKQKLVIARSLFDQSNIYIYDEPTKNLDSSSKLDLYNILNALALEGATILLISSDYSELIGMCSRVILLKDGQQIGNYSTHYLSVEALSKELE